MNSLASLNRKWWYRLLKVTFCLLFITTIAASVPVVYTKNKVTFQNDAKITCNYGNHQTFYANQDKGISLQNFDPSASKLPDGLNTRLMQACAITDADVTQAQADSAAATAELRIQQNYDRSRNVLLDSFVIKNTYDINPARLPIDNSRRAIMYVVLDIAVCCLAFEFIRRIFYYVALGKIRPPQG